MPADFVQDRKREGATQQIDLGTSRLEGNGDAIFIQAAIGPVNAHVQTMFREIFHIHHVPRRSPYSRLSLHLAAKGSPPKSDNLRQYAIFRMNEFLMWMTGQDDTDTTALRRLPDRRRFLADLPNRSVARPLLAKW